MLGIFDQGNMELVSQVLEYLWGKEMNKFDRLMCHTPGFCALVAMMISSGIPSSFASCLHWMS